MPIFMMIKAFLVFAYIHCLVCVSTGFQICANENMGMDDSLDIKRIVDALDHLKQIHIGKYIENIIEFCQKEHSWDRPKIE